MSAADYQDDDLKNIKANESNGVKADFASKVMPIKSKEWQGYLVWRVLVMRGALVISYSGKNGGMIFCNRKVLENILNTIKMESQFNKNGKETYQFQEPSYNYVSRCTSNQAGTTGPSKVSFKFIRVSFSTKKCLLYQNTFEVEPTNLTLGQNLQSTMIEMTMEELLSPLQHISIQAISNKTDSMNMGEFDID